VSSPAEGDEEVSHVARRLLQVVPKKYIGLIDYATYRPKKCYSQNGEDIIARRYFDFHGPLKGVYVDIGCFHPKHDSNTYLLYKSGWRGINVDADEYKIEVFKVARPRDINLCVAVSAQRGSAEFFFQPDSVYGSMGGLDEDAVRSEAAEVGRRIERRVVQTMPLNDILEENSIEKVDFLSIDVEGHEAAVLENFNFSKYPIPLLAVEIQGEFDQVLSSPIHKHLCSNGYMAFARTVPTMFYVRRTS
jgi:FkbM family methyltransferase